MTQTCENNNKYGSRSSCGENFLVVISPLNDVV